MLNNQAALYRVNKLTPGKDLWHKSYEEVQVQKLQVRIELYRMIHMEAMEPNETISTIWSRIKDIREVSDVLVVNQGGELSCFYVNEEYPRRITGFIRVQTSGALISLDTRDYKIDGYGGNWMAADDVIIDGRQFFLMEHQEYHRQTAMVVLDSYGRKVAECIHGFDREVKQKIHEFVRAHHQDTPSFYNLRRRLEPWQKFLINGFYERSMEIGLEVNYDGIDGCVNHQKDHPGKALPEKKEKGAHLKKRTSVIRKLREKQIAIARRAGKPIPKFLEQQVEREKSRR